MNSHHEINEPEHIVKTGESRNTGNIENMYKVHVRVYMY